MRKMTVWLFVLVISASLFVSSTTEAGPPNPARALAGLSDVDVKKRLGAITELVESLGSRDAGELTNDLLPAIVKGMSDSDAEVRRMSFGCVNMLANAIRLSKVNKGGPVYGVKVSVAFEKSPELKELLEKGLADPSPEIRGYSIVGLAAGYPPSPEMENRLNRLLTTEKSKRGREMIIGGLAAWNYSSPTTLKNLRSALRDTDFNVQAHAARYLSDIKDEEALATLVEKVPDSKRSTKVHFLNSIANYGKRAQPHLGELKQWERGEKDEKVKEAFHLTIEKVEKAK